jgi:cytochrome d ubiquinol oxidase subunit II
MGTIWFCLVSFMVGVYVVLDGYDIGAGIIYLFVARGDSDRRLVLRTIGPVWDGNEVWLLAAGGTLYFAFPALYASAFSGFYLPLVILLWLLILRGLSIEFRNHIDHPVWKPIWDAGFFAASAVLAIFFGAALGNVVRGVPLDEKGYFFAPLWTHFGVAGETGILDWYTIPVALAAFLTLTMHGALWVALKTEGELSARCRRTAAWAWWGVAISTGVITYLTFIVQPQVPANLAARPWGYVFPALALAGLAGTGCFAWRRARDRSDLLAFLSSSASILGMLMSAVFGIYPYVLPATTGLDRGLTVETAKAADYGLEIGLVWWAIGMALAAVYFIHLYGRFRGKVRLDEEGY